MRSAEKEHQHSVRFPSSYWMRISTDSSLHPIQPKETVATHIPSPFSYYSYHSLVCFPPRINPYENAKWKKCTSPNKLIFIPLLPPSRRRGKNTTNIEEKSGRSTWRGKQHGNGNSHRICLVALYVCVILIILKVSGICCKIVEHPFDTIKVLMQVNGSVHFEISLQRRKCIAIPLTV